MTRNKWLAFSIAMPEQLIPIYDFLQNELNEILSDDYYRNQLESLDLSIHKGKIWMQMRKMFVNRVKEWDKLPYMHNKSWYARILFENIRRELQSKYEATTVWNELVKNDMEVNQTLFDNLVSKHKIYATRGMVSNIKRSNKSPELVKNATFQLDYTVSDKQFFIMNEDNTCEIKINKKDWIKYKIILPSSLNHNLTGKIAKPRFFKRKKDGKYIGLCSYQYVPEKPEGKNVLGVDIGQIKLFSAVALYKDGNYSSEYVNSNYLRNKNTKLKKLYEEKENLYKIINQNELLNVKTNKNEKRKEHFFYISNRIKNIKKDIARNVAQEIIQVAKQEKCNEIHIEDLRWMDSKGGKWNHAEIHKMIKEKAISAGIEIIKVNPAYSSSEHPITGERGLKSNRNVTFKDNQSIDRDVLAAVNIAIRNKRKKKGKINKLKRKHQQIVLKKKSRRKEIFERIADIKRNTKIVVFQPCVPNPNKELGAWSCIKQVQPNSSLLTRYTTTVLCDNL